MESDEDLQEDLQEDVARGEEELKHVRGMVAQLSDISAEMNRLKSQIHGDLGLGRIQREIASIKSELGGMKPELSDESFDDELVALVGESERSRVGFGAALSVVLVVFVLCGPMWPLTAGLAENVTSLFRPQTVPWYDREL